MATANYQPTVTSTFYLNQAKPEPSPPETYPYGTGAYTITLSQTPPSANISPTSLQSPHINVRQLRQPRQPMYIPAALRPTDPTARPTDIPGRPRAPDTPPASKDNSFDSGKSHATASTMEVGVLPLGGFHGSEIDLLRRNLSRAASEGMDEEPQDVSGPPTTAHWKPDVSAPECAVCRQTFTWFFRRHHCRRCGDIVCDNHFTKKVPLDQNARLHSKGVASKACDLCWQEWAVLKKLRISRTSSIAGSSTSSQDTAVPPLPIPQRSRMPDGARVGSMARSEGMEWSTF
ncbi:Zn finger protein [Friedmanniomyces endolithicus]|nr:Zn finger protein [Friedmanniomyces endolithicus]